MCCCFPGIQEFQRLKRTKTQKFLYIKWMYTKKCFFCLKISRKNTKTCRICTLYIVQCAVQCTGTVQHTNKKIIERKVNNMRRNTRTAIEMEGARIQNYHEGGTWDDEQQYAFMGYTENRYFTSDRFIKLNENFEREDGKPLKGFGLEIEVECFNITSQKALAEVLDKIVFAMFPPHLFKMQRDGSLGGESSAECITQPMSKEFIRNNYRNFKVMYDHYFPIFGISASETGHCGMHCNISNGMFGRDSKTQETAIRKLYYMINKHFDLMCRLVNRKPSATHYCSRMDYEIAKTMNLHNIESNHYICFNLGHYDSGRIELRLVGGQKNFPCFRNTMESIFHLIEASKTLEWKDLDDVTRIFSGCNNYVYDRLRTFCYEGGCITTEQLETIKETVKREQFI